MPCSNNFKDKDKFMIGVFLPDVFSNELVMDSDIQTEIFGCMDHFQNLTINSCGY